jgi:hypothetical protein
MIKYHSTKPTLEPGFRRLQWTAGEQGTIKLTVRTRSGYYPVMTVAKKPKSNGQ